MQSYLALVLSLFCVTAIIFVFRTNVYFCCIRFSFFSTGPRDCLGITSPKWPILYRVRRKTLTQTQSLCPRESVDWEWIMSCEWFTWLALGRHLWTCEQWHQWLTRKLTLKTIICMNVCFDKRFRNDIFGSRPSDHYFRSVCWFVHLSVCLFVQSFSQPSLIRFRSN